MSGMAEKLALVPGAGKNLTPNAEVELPPPPSGLNVEHKALFTRIAQHLRDRGLLDGMVDVEIIARYVFCVQQAKAIRRKLGREFITEGSKEQPVVNPLATLLMATERDAAAYAKALLLDPNSRIRAGVPEEDPTRKIYEAGVAPRQR